MASWTSKETGPLGSQLQMTARVLQPGWPEGGHLSSAEPPATTRTCRTGQEAGQACFAQLIPSQTEGATEEPLGERAEHVLALGPLYDPGEEMNAQGSHSQETRWLQRV